MALISKVPEPENFESQNSLKLSFTNILFIFSLVVFKSLLESSSPDILNLCKIDEGDFIESSNFSVKYYISLISKDYVTHMYVLVIYMKEGTFFST